MNPGSSVCRGKPHLAELLLGYLILLECDAIASSFNGKLPPAGKSLAGTTKQTDRAWRIVAREVSRAVLGPGGLRARGVLLHALSATHTHGEVYIVYLYGAVQSYGHGGLPPHVYEL